MNSNDLKLIDTPFIGCPICGGTLVKIRGKYPKDTEREVCPTCLADVIDDIHNMSSKSYRMSAQAESYTP